MGRKLFSTVAVCIFSVFQSILVFPAEENFILLNGLTDEVVQEFGPSLDERLSPCSSFKIPLSLMGYEAGVLEDTEAPAWDFQEGYDDFLDFWKASVTPLSWMSTSCIWFSKVLSLELGLEVIENDLALFAYGNQDVSFGLVGPGPGNPVWVCSSLTISPREQADFVKRMVRRELPLSDHAVEMTKRLVFKEDLSGGWKLFGKTGWSGSSPRLQHGWFVGWIEKQEAVFPFAYLIRAETIDLAHRVPRVKELLERAGVMDD